MKTFIAFSGGVESTTLCLLFGGKADAIFADTGDEHVEMYERLGQVEGILRTIYPSFRVVRVSAGEALHDYIRRKKVFPGPVMRFCTRIFKIEPINAYLETYAPCKAFGRFSKTNGARVYSVRKSSIASNLRRQNRPVEFFAIDNIKEKHYG